MPTFVLSAKAKEDLKSIGHYTQKLWGREQRNRYLSLLDGSFQFLSLYPLKGKDCSEILPQYRKSSIGQHIIFYRQLDKDRVEVVRILHQRMDVIRHLRGS